jgi:predicted DNA-binding protein (MmcQ/YjbR family)
MAKPVVEDKRLTKLTELCLAFPETERKIKGDHADFRVRGKVFAYFLDNHHGDGVVSVCFKAVKGENTLRVQEDPVRRYLPAYIGSRGWFGLRLDVGQVNWAEVEHLLQVSYRLAAPKTLVRKLDEE